MSTSANVKSIQALADLKTMLARYGGDVQETLQRMARTIEQTRHTLTERQNHWRIQVRRCEEQLAQARAALTHCQNSAYTDREGRRHVPDCRRFEQTVSDARRQLDAANQALRNVEQAITQVEAAVHGYEQHARRLSNFVNSDLKSGQALLERKITTLQAYVAGGLIGGAVGLVANVLFNAGSPVEHVTNLQETMLGMLAAGAQLQDSSMIGVGLALLNVAAKDLRHQLGDAGEVLSQQLLTQQFDWHALKFDQPKHGFDRVMQAPGLSAIIVESKVNRAGQFRLGQTNAGEQGSPGWTADKIEKMANPLSAQYSQTNAQLADLIHELGHENVPVVAVAIETESGNASIHYRSAGLEEWQVLKAGEDLTERLRSATTAGGE